MLWGKSGLKTLVFDGCNHPGSSCDLLVLFMLLSSALPLSCGCSSVCCTCLNVLGHTP